MTKTPLSPRMHLSQEQVAKLLPMLQHFVETGRLPEPDEREPDERELLPISINGLPVAPEHFVSPDGVRRSATDRVRPGDRLVIEIGRRYDPLPSSDEPE